MRWIIGIAILFVASVANATWYEARTPHFVIYSDQSPDDLRAFAERLEKFDKAVRIVRGMDDPPVGEGGKVTIYVLPNTTAVSRLATGRVTSIAGLYLARAEGSVAFVPKRVGSGRGTDIDAETIFRHEYAHHLMRQNMDAAFPPWYVEGFAEFFSSAEFPKDGSVQVGHPADHRAGALFGLDRIAMDELLGASFKQSTEADQARFYARAWLLTHYLAFADERKGQLAAYVNGIQQGLKPLAAAEKAFGDLRELGSEVERYLRKRRFTFLRVAGPQLNVAPPAIRPLTAGEAAMMDVRMRSARGVTKESAEDVLQLARKQSAPFPNDPGVQTVLAEAEFDAGNYREASAAAGRALSANPRSLKALIYKGRAEMELAYDQDDPDWDRVRKWFLDANKVDPEAPEPLMRFYESFARAGERPTKNAIDALLYAQVLAPHDQGLRLTAAALLIDENRLGEAEKTLAPLAYSPHDGGLRERARKVLTALEQGNREAALAALK